MAGIYIHIPFCKQKCTYCDFHFSTTYHGYQNRMIAAICKEIELQKRYLNNQPIQTIYFGGGTPSLLSKKELTQLLSTIHTHFDTSNMQEITLEANPDDISNESVSFWKKIGINRLSVGLQSFKEDDLKWMNRAHTVNEALHCVEIAVKSGIPNITVDLIYGLPGLTNEEWKNHIETAINMGVQHISAYCLTVEQGTGLSHHIKIGKITPATEQNQIDQFLILVDTLEEYGFKQYEISNFCLPGFESKHNSSYWKGIPYLGIGPSAHSYNGTKRSWNIRNNHGYMNALENEENWFEEELLTPNDIFNETLLIGLRISEGVDLNVLAKIRPLNASFNKQLETFILDQLIIQNGSIIQLTKEGRLQADRIASDLFYVD
ncbi:MAG: radical SAM family heme chaperone HemW [Crocinitomicaceae bacterium]|nr:radical SAM family heme chaperone HemW [Crocinitomicaceae bacterium]